MNEMILDTRGLLESLIRLLRTDKVKVRELRRSTPYTDSQNKWHVPIFRDSCRLWIYC